MAILFVFFFRRSFHLIACRAWKVISDRSFYLCDVQTSPLNGVVWAPFWSLLGSVLVCGSVCQCCTFGACVLGAFPGYSHCSQLWCPSKACSIHFLRHWFICSLPDMNYSRACGLWPAFLLVLLFLYAHVIFQISLLNKVPINFCLAGQREPELPATVPLLFTGDIHSLRKCKLKAFFWCCFCALFLPVMCYFPSTIRILRLSSIVAWIAEGIRTCGSFTFIKTQKKLCVLHLLKVVWFSTSQTLIKAEKIYFRRQCLCPRIIIIRRTQLFVSN